MLNNAKWYVVHTYSGYENKVKTNLEKIIENRGLEELISEVVVPLEEVVEKKDDVEKTVSRKVFPGYVLIKMVMTDDTWYVIRNTTGVTGFVGPGSKPVPLSEEEVEALGVDKKEIIINFSAGDSVKIVKGPFANQIGVVDEIDKSTGKITVSVVMFGRKTALELDADQVEEL
ncbi:transcription termination/antitermination protein NusG [Qingrenia yutianensis]|uniref:Transcription termination/antitermination protein NusG n=1 Tax=Qingrenia yutianensis TaxID=2763676 RepID=A0A926ISD4_9FIRM|nr:transcription termination/antitermination protein NusG [Qingrenia yutianensis]MBC8596279.1 transcription termination/antitermination factor NusG [Qingrenia yutianensis]